MTLPLVILLVVALCVSIRIIVLLRRNLNDSEDLTEDLVVENTRLAQKNAELTVLSAVMFSAARRNEGIAAALTAENADLRRESESHVTSLSLLLAEMDK